MGRFRTSIKHIRNPHIPTYAQPELLNSSRNETRYASPPFLPNFVTVDPKIFLCLKSWRARGPGKKKGHPSNGTNFGFLGKCSWVSDSSFHPSSDVLTYTHVHPVKTIKVHRIQGQW